MRRFIFLLTFIALIIASPSLLAQDVSIQAGISTTSMSDLHRIQSANSTYPAQLKILQDFPAYWQYSLLMRWRVGKIYRLGFDAFTTSTGARASLADYSGVSRSDVTAKCYGVAIYNGFLFKASQKMELFAYVEVGVIYSDVNQERFVQVPPTIYVNESQSSSSLSKMLEFGVDGRYFLGHSRWFAKAKFGILVNFASPLEYKDNTNYTVNPGADWSGLRLLGGVGFRFGKAKK